MSLLPTSIPTTSSPAALNGSQNTTNSKCAHEDPEEWTYSVLTGYILTIAVLGIVFNLFVLMVFCLHKKACTVAEIYLSNLAAADLILVTFLPVWAVYVFKRYNWPFNRLLCRLLNLPIIMNAYCSIYFLVLVSIDRYVALVHPLSHERMRRPKYAKLGCLLVWALGFLLSVPTLIYRDLKQPQSNVTSCYLNYTSNTVRLLCESMMPTFGFIIPIPIISFCTVKIIQALNNRLTDEFNSQKVEHKATTLVLAVLIVFLICWVPFHLVKVMEILARFDVLTGCTIENIIETGKQIFTYFAFFNSVLNPILYVIVGKNFRKKVKEFFQMWVHKRTGTLSLSSTRTSLSRSTKAKNASAGLPLCDHHL